jgi:hypothetical protein
MIPFKGKSNLKQYIQSKPKKWGFKIWVQANSNRYVNCFEPYQASIQDRSKYGPIGDSVLNLCHALHGKNHKLFMDNLFTSLPLIRQLRFLSIWVIGTVRINRIGQIQTSIVPGKMLQRGSCTLDTSKDNITVLRWIDKREVHMISSYAGAEPFDEILRYDKKEKQRYQLLERFVFKNTTNVWEVWISWIVLYLTILTALKTINGTFEYFFDF